MPKQKKDPSKLYTTESGSVYYTSTKEAGKDWVQKQREKKRYAQVTVRLSEDARNKVSEYVARKAEEDPTNLKFNTYTERTKTYTPSVNALVKYLLEEELGVNLD